MMLMWLRQLASIDSARLGCLGPRSGISGSLAVYIERPRTWIGTAVEPRARANGAKLETLVEQAARTTGPPADLSPGSTPVRWMGSLTLTFPRFVLSAVKEVLRCDWR
jgi:hypothetical protein